MTDDVTTGELARAIARVERSVAALRSEVLTVPVWKAEREYLDHRLAEATRIATEAKVSAGTEAAKVQAKVDAAGERQAVFRRTIIGVVVSVGLVWIGQLVWQLVSLVAQGV